MVAHLRFPSLFFQSSRWNINEEECTIEFPTIFEQQYGFRGTPGLTLARTLTMHRLKTITSASKVDSENQCPKMRHRRKEWGIMGRERTNTIIIGCWYSKFKLHCYFVVPNKSLQAFTLIEVYVFILTRLLFLFIFYLLGYDLPSVMYVLGIKLPLGLFLIHSNISYTCSFLFCFCFLFPSFLHDIKWTFKHRWWS